MVWTKADNGPEWPQALVPLLRGMNVSHIELRSFTRPRSFLGREVSGQAQELARAARQVSKTRGYGFWDEMLSTLHSAGTTTRLAALERATAHNLADIAVTEHSLEFLAEHLCSGHYQGLPARQVVSLSSRVMAEQKTSHIPMLDLGTRDAATAIDVLTTLNLDGVLVASGTSFHYVGATLFSEADMLDLLARSQLLSPLVDHRWAAHSILDRCCSLRISTDIEKHPTPWRTVATSSG